MEGGKCAKATEDLLESCATVLVEFIILSGSRMAWAGSFLSRFFLLPIEFVLESPFLKSFPC